MAQSEADPNPAQIRDVVAIDGPSGAGKSTVARRLAERLGFAYLDTGAMYRAVTWVLLERRVDGAPDEVTVAALLGEMQLQIGNSGRVIVNGRDVTAHLRSAEVESRVSAVSAMPVVRGFMRDLQRQVAAAGPIVVEGRDMGTVVFPAARWKVYLDADPRERARRRLEDFQRSGRDVTQKEVLEEIVVRDRLDSTRKDAPLRRAPGAVDIDTSGHTVEEVVEQLAGWVRGRSGTAP
ncbi:MAG: (d)CMP kinase [Planctomycetota bacterium]